MTITGHTGQGPAPLPDRQRMLSEAVELHQRGRLLEAERIYRRILQAEPGNPDALHLLGLIAKQAGQADAAIGLVRQAIANNPEVPAFWSNLAMMFEEEGRHEDCESAARGALKLDPWNGQALHCLANALRASDRYEEAADAYERAVRVISDDAALWSNYGATLKRLGRIDGAVEALRRALALSPGQAEMHSNLGNALLAAGQHQAAVDEYREALRVDPTFAAGYTNLANALLQSGRANEAVAVLRQCLDAHPGDRKAIAYLAAAVAETGDERTRDTLLDFDRFMARRQWSAPAGYESLEAFNEALVAHVTRHGTLRWEPLSKTTRGGSQTGELLGEPGGPIATLEGMIRTAIDDYLAALPQDPEHPFLGSVPSEWTLTLWATVLDREGHQAAHLHPTGWLSGVYYAAVPEPPGSSPDHAGWIEFGRAPDNFALEREQATRLFEPTAGLMLLFPSYFYHRTVPFAGEGQRVSIAFDLMPADEREQEATATARLSPAEVEAETGRVREMLGGGRVRDAIGLARRLVTSAPDNAAAAYLLGVALYRSGDPAQALEWLESACRLAPDEARYVLDLGTCNQQLGHSEAAVAALEKSAELDGTSIEPFMRLATLHSDRGRFDDARDAYERALERDPGSGPAHYGLALMKKFETADPQIDRIRSVLAAGGMEPDQEAVLWFALGRALDQTGELDEAMDAFARGNRLKRELTDFDVVAERANVDRIIGSFGPEVFRTFDGSGDDSELPVFVIGMPRSGTTLVEQILDSHPRVFGAGELNDLWRTVNRIGRWLPAGRSLPEAVTEVDPQAWADMGAQYVRRIRRYSKGAERIVDKLPFNYTLAGLIRLMLPRARIIHCVRDPRDTCVSCYLTSFQNDRGFTCDLAELGETYRHYWRLMTHWGQVLPDAILDVRYESLVDDVEGQARAIVDHLGLEWSDDCLRFFENPRMVSTASMSQVRQPVYRSSVGRWRRYEHYLEPLLQALGDLRQYGIDEG
jgi:tetratricopeptide (TPR) repeat protein